MRVVETQRTLVKSVPELWAQLSEGAVLERMLGHFGEIRITRLVPEASVEWQSELAAGCVELEPSGFGTRVRLVAEIAAVEEPPAPEPAPAQRVGFWARILRRGPPAPPAVQAPPPPADAIDAGVAQGALTAVLDEIGTARHRPFSRDFGAPGPTT